MFKAELLPPINSSLRENTSASSREQSNYPIGQPAGDDLGSLIVVNLALYHVTCN